MINFRFHLVSLIAVFLAMGLGILVGSTVVDQVIVDRLDREISSVSHESNQLKSDNSELKDQVSKLNDFLQKSSAYAVQQRLTAVPVAIVAEKGVDVECGERRARRRCAPRAPTCPACSGSTTSGGSTRPRTSRRCRPRRT